MRGLTFIALALASPAFADCPSADDLTGGIRVLGPDKVVETYQTVGENLVLNTYLDANGDGSESLLARGIWLIQLRDINGGAPDPSSRRTYTYPLSPADMPLPEPGGAWSAKVVTFDNGGLSTGDQDMQFLDATILTMGACTYQMIPAQITYDDGFRETLYWMPELGFALYGAAKDVGAEEERYTFTGIEKVAQ